MLCKTDAESPRLLPPLCGRLMDSPDDNIVSLLGELAFCANCPPLDSDACPA
jgi:hypothetical protein